MATGTIYEITCNECKEPVDPDSCLGQHRSKQPGGQPRHNYVGSSRTSLHQRMLAHMRGQRQKQGSNPLHRHDVEIHEGQQQEYTARVIGREQNILPLKILEGLYIEAQAPGTSMNERMEFGRGGLVRLTAIRE